MNTNALKPVRFGDIIEFEIISLAFGGDSVGRFQDFAVFVPGGLPGERVRVKITQVKDQFATGEIQAVLRHSPDRVAPVCPIFEECGGCQWQHFNYPRQLQTKRQFVVDSLQRIGRLNNIDVQPCLPSPNPYAYRNKAMPVISMRDGHFISGIYEPRSHHLIPYNTCPIQGDPINDLIQKVLQKIDRSGLTPYQEKKHTGFLRHLTVRQGVKTGELLLAFVTRTEIPDERLQKPAVLPEEMNQILPRIARELMEEVPGLVGVLQNINPSRTNIVFGPSTALLAGRDHYYEIIDGLKLKVSLKSFLQVNTAQADLLHAIVREALGEPANKKKWGTVLDLYSGIGTLAMAVSDKADYVVGAEEVSPAVEDAKFNADLNHKNNIDYLEGDVAQILMGLKDKGLSQIDAAILDPPRKGVLPEVLARITALRPERLVYVSCDPSTLARDLALLVKHGFTVDWVQPLDMFPQTYHVETVVKLTRQAPVAPEVVAPAAAGEPEPFRLSKPVEPASLNVTANFKVLKEKTSSLFVAIIQQLRAVLGLALALVLSLAVGLYEVFRVLGRGLYSLFHAAGKTSVKTSEALQDFSRERAEHLSRLTKSGAQKSQTFMASVIERTAAVKGKFLSAFTRGPREQAPDSHALKDDFPDAFLPEVEISNLEAQVTTSEEEVLASVFASSFKVSNLEMKPPAASEPSSYPNIQNTPGLISDPSVGLTLPRSESEHEKPLWPPLRKPRFQWKLPVLSLPKNVSFSGLRGGKTLRWALAAAILAGGGWVAKATLSPEAKRSGSLVATVSQVIPDVIAVMPSRNFLRYEMVPFEVKINAAEMPTFSQMRAAVEVYRGGEPVSMVDGKTKLILKKDPASGKFIGNWPIPYNPAPGTYIAEVVVSAPQWESAKTFESAFTISPLKPSGLYPGYAGLTMEGGKQMVGGAVPALDGGDSFKSANAIDWAQFMGANLFCYLMGQTSIWDHLNPKDFPFNRGDLETGDKYARAAHNAGLKFAGYMTTFKVVGDAWNQAPYEFSLGYDPDTDEVIQTRFISLEDKKRRQDIVDFLKRLNEDEDVDLVGLDYVRTGSAGYEMVDEFVKDLSVPGPADYWSMNKQERIHWLAKTVELKENKDVVALFEWWRAHKVALTLKGILDEAKMNKPVFTFTLGWQMGHQHGQDPAMFVDAGVNFNHIMLYEGDRDTLESMKRQWPEYLSRANGMYAMGEMVDFNWVQKSLNPPAPEELYNREMETFHNWFPVNANVGMFWHDLYRIIYGIRGPYSSMEWLISGGKAFSTLQQAEGLSPIEVSLVAPKEIPAGVPVPISVMVRNHSPENLKGMVLHQLDTTKDYNVDLATVGPFDLPAGNMVKVKSLYVNIPREDHPERDNRYMAAVMVEKPGQALRAFDFVYLKKLSSGSAVKTLEDEPSRDASEPVNSKK